MRRLHAVTLLIAAGMLAGSLPAGAAGVTAKFPPPDRDALARIFDPRLAPLGLRVTRAALQRAGTYEEDGKGRHLAVYVEPTGEYTTADYVHNIVPVARVFLPKVFDRWSGLRSFDVCQEPLPTDDASAVPPPVTQLAVTRRGAERVRWREAELADVLAAEPRSRRDREASPSVFHLYVNRVLRNDPDFQQAKEEAADRRD